MEHGTLYCTTSLAVVLKTKRLISNRRLVYFESLLALTILFSCQQEGCCEKPYTVHQWLHPLVCIMSNSTLYSWRLRNRNKVRHKYRIHFTPFINLQYIYLVVRFRFSRFLFWYEAVHAAVWTLPVVTSVLKEMRFAQSCTWKYKTLLKHICFSTQNIVPAFTPWNTPSADCRNGSEGSSWEVGAAASSSSSCSVPICIPEYWLSLPSSTLCTQREQIVTYRNQRFFADTLDETSINSNSMQYLRPRLVTELDLLNWGRGHRTIQLKSQGNKHFLLNSTKSCFKTIYSKST